MDASPAQDLLDVVAGLIADSRAAGGENPAPSLDCELERDLGIDSLALAELLLRVESRFDVRLPQGLLARAATPRDLLRAIFAGSPREAQALEAAPLLQPSVGEARPDLRGATLPDVLDWHAERHPDRVHVLVLAEDREDGGDALTYGELRAQAREIAAGLANAGVGAGDTVALMLPTSRDYFRAFMGILLAGAVPVPIYPPASRTDIAGHARRQARILDNCQARLLVTVPAGKGLAQMLRALVPSLAGVCTVDELAIRGAAPATVARTPSDIAFLQYTSGSTGDPKGVVLTHANLLANIGAMGTAIGAGADDVFVSWLPLYHDMGLIGGWMGGLCFAFPLVAMPPTAFISRPSRWLRAIHRHRGTVSAAPNFAYEMCATRVDERDLEGLDLSRWRLAFNGAEPVSAATLDRFARRYAPRGFRREAFMPVYGMAECALGVAFPPPGRGPLVDRIDRAALASAGEARPARADDAQALALVGCGAPLPGYEIRVAGPDSRELPERSEGRLEFRGPSATSGYFRNPGKTAALIHDGWLDTGDLGYLAGGEVFITGRAKDLIIRGGQHVHPYELEEAVGAIPGVRKGCVAVFGAPDAASGTEKVVVLAETRLAAGAERDALRARVATTALEMLGAPADEIVLAPPHTVPKTSSGKIRRAASRELYLQGMPRTGGIAAWMALARVAADAALARVRRGTRLVGQVLYGAWLWTALAPLTLAALAASALPESTLRWRLVRGCARTLLHASGLPVTLEGIENIPATGAAVLVANHSSYLDGPLLFALLPRRMRVVVKRELASQPLAARILGAVGVAWVERFDTVRATDDARAFLQHARDGEALLFFPEGTLTRAPGLAAFQMGAFVTAAQAGIPVVPVAVLGTRSIMRDGQWRPRRGPVRVCVGEPRRAAGPRWEDAARLREIVRADVLARCGEPDIAR